MFGGRRRRTLVGAALVAGTATVAARHGARKQSQIEAERQFQMEQEIEFRRIAEERERLRNQRDIDQAVNDALAKQQAGNNSQVQPAAPSGPGAAPIMMPPPGPPPTYMAADAYLHPAMAAGPVPPRPRSTSAADSGVCFCSECGSRCGVQDKFCRGCGSSLSSGAYSQPAKQGV
ncbi:hypothetical protein TOPH_09054 [Tolypocladium ophioglossoides CBS 100239]|uniref:Zinc ribbon domain-containing protein n=1 Tax=Tolypocladium ophioglossoides (strain CBS 100239) TaxID=1163406 RepID=A0A0L0MWL6_TOLOC|nr:hypothetical protein TOPH_09054 [Tolypocladium ophioglossoides CBS 100239]